MAYKPTKEESVFIPIEWAEDGAVAPASTVLISNGNGEIRVRKFASDQTEDVTFPWKVPDDIVAADGITFEVPWVVTEATGPSAEGVSFKAAGYSAGSGDGIGGTFGTEVESNNTALTEIQYDYIKSTKSTKVTITNLKEGELVMINLNRDHDDADDTYGQDVGVAGIIIHYTKQL